MPRLHLWELEDQAWFPTSIRNYMTDLLNFQITWFQIYDPIVPILYRALLQTRSKHVLDLCSGGAGSSRRVQEILAKRHGLKVQVNLSDLYPNANARLRIKALNDKSITYLKQAVDAMNVPPDLDGFRTLFTSFHHFAPEKAQRILKDAAQKDQGIAIFELSERSLRGFVLVILSFFLTFIVTPFMRPFCWQRLFFTYVIPLIPGAYLFDGLVSQVRSYTKTELLALSQAIDARYTWETGTIKHHLLPFYVSYLVGYNRQSNGQ